MYTNTQEQHPTHRNYSKLLISESPLQVLPTLAVKIGLNEALMLQQVHYWISNPMNKNLRNGRVWVYKTYSEWQQEFPFWSMRTIQRTMLSLEHKKILIANNFNKLITDRTKWYTIDYDKLDSLEIGILCQNDLTIVPTWHDADSANLAPSIPETTPEITKKDNNKPKVVGCSMTVAKKKFHTKQKPVVQPKPKPEPKAEQAQKASEPNGVVVVNSEIDDLMKMIVGWAISRVLVSTWAKKHGAGYVFQKIELTKSAIGQGKVRSRGAYLNKAVELDWLPPAPHEDQEAQNKPVEPTFPTHEENVDWYDKLADNEKLSVLGEAGRRNPYLEYHLKNTNTSVLDEGFSGSTWFKMMMSTVGKAA
jgi:hypothetical protein